MSTVAEIEAAIEGLSADEVRRLRDLLLSRPVGAAGGKAKTGGELARLWPSRFHLRPAEADELAADLERARGEQSRPKPTAWE